MYNQIAANKRKTIVLMIGFVLVVGALGYLFTYALGRPGLVAALTIGATIYAVIGYFASARIALALSGAKQIEERDAPELYRAVENLAIAGGLPMPKVYIVNDSAPNAFATGRDPEHAVVAATTGLLEIMDKSELEGVIAHELSHVGNYDTRLMGVVMVLVSVVALVSDFFLRITWWGGDDDERGNPVFAVIGIVAALLAPIVATLVQLAVSRRREYLADASGALLTRFPQGLESALTKIAMSNQATTSASSATAHLYFTNPLRGRGVRAGLTSLLSTHPPIDDRIARLKEMEN